MSQTIAAISTPPAPAGLGVIRLSGDEAVAVASRVFRPGRAGRDLAGLKGYTAAYGHVFDEEGDIDDCVALVFRAPHSYTGRTWWSCPATGGCICSGGCCGRCWPRGRGQRARANSPGELSLTASWI